MAQHTISRTAQRTDARRERVGVPAQSLLLGLVRSVRPSQWTKNLFVFFGLLFGQRLLDPSSIRRSVLAFAVFCALSGVVYLVNDVADRSEERRVGKECRSRWSPYH